jgi:hypothetical protein
MDAAQTAAPPVPPKISRRTYVIDRGFQLKYTLTLVIVGALISALFGGMMYLAHVDAQRLMNPPPDIREALARTDATLLTLIGAITVLMAAAFGLFGILITHRVAGPVFVMSHYVSVLARGRYPILRKLRKNDELKSFFETFQEAIEALRLKEAEEARRIENAIAVLSPTATGPEAQQALEELRAIQQRKCDATDRVDLAGTGLTA